jgi:hypothetical protein
MQQGTNGRRRSGSGSDTNGTSQSPDRRRRMSNSQNNGQSNGTQPPELHSSGSQRDHESSSATDADESDYGSRRNGSPGKPNHSISPDRRSSLSTNGTNGNGSPTKSDHTHHSHRTGTTADGTESVSSHDGHTSHNEGGAGHSSHNEGSASGGATASGSEKKPSSGNKRKGFFRTRSWGLKGSSSRLKLVTLHNQSAE